MKKICTFVLLFSLFFSSPVYAESTLVSGQNKTAQINIVFDEVFSFFEKLRLAGLDYFTGVRDKAKTRLNIGTLPSSPKMNLGHAGEVPEKDFKRGDVELDNPLDYPVYIGSSSLVAIFSNKSLFYITSILLTLIIIRSVLIRIKYS